MSSNFPSGKMLELQNIFPLRQFGHFILKMLGINGGFLSGIAENLRKGSLSKHQE